MHIRRVGGLNLAERSLRDVIAITAGTLSRPAFASGVYFDCLHRGRSWMDIGYLVDGARQVVMDGRPS